MDINLISFGKAIRKLREGLHLTQKDVSESSGINTETLRRIEHGRVIPRFESLDYLSVTYKKDLINLFLQYQIDEYAYFYYLKNKLEIKFDKNEFYTLDKEVEKLKLLLDSTNNLFHENIIRQLILLTEAVISYKDNKDYNMALDNLEKAMKITIGDFNSADYKSFTYSSMEVRILMNIAFVLNRLNYKEKYLEIIEFCLHHVDTDDKLYSKLSYNLAGAHYRNKNFHRALIYSNIGIESCQKTSDFNGLNLLYYIKGLSEYKLNKENYIKSLNTSIALSTSFGQNIITNTIIDNCENYLKIKLFQDF